MLPGLDEPIHRSQPGDTASESHTCALGSDLPRKSLSSPVLAGERSRKTLIAREWGAPRHLLISSDPRIPELKRLCIQGHLTGVRWRGHTYPRATALYTVGNVNSGLITTPSTHPGQRKWEYVSLPRLVLSKASPGALRNPQRTNNTGGGHGQIPFYENTAPNRNTTELYGPHLRVWNNVCPVASTWGKSS